MTLGAALSIGRSGVLTHQHAVEVTGDNLANQATEGFHRRRITLEPIRSHEIQAGMFLGRGVGVQSITRQVDAALEGRLRANISDMSTSAARKNVLSQIESLQNEFSDADLSSYLNRFFNAWSELANNPQDNAARSLVLREGADLAAFIAKLRAELVALRSQVDHSIGSAVAAADDVLTRIQSINERIVAHGGTSHGAPALRDARDIALGELAEYLDVSVNELDSGVVEVFVGSMPLILNGVSRGIELRRASAGDRLEADVVLRDDASPLNVTAGRVAGLLVARSQDVDFAIDQLDSYANSLIFEVNQVHSQGQALAGPERVAAANRVADADAALNSSATGLAFRPRHGSFQIHVTQQSTQLRASTTIQVDLDGIAPDADTTLNQLTAAIDAVENVSATVDLDGRLHIAVDGSDFEISFSEDSSGVLAALGINSFFAGADASDIAVGDIVNATPDMIAASRTHHPGDNANALALAAMKDQPVADLGGQSLLQAWGRHVEELAMRLDRSDQQLEADSVVNDSLRAQQQAVSGVNGDEEVINLLAFQRAYQGSARFLRVVDELMETLLSLA